MPALCRRLNYRNIELHPHTAGETVDVRLRLGGTRQVRWLGFIALEEARALRGAKPVKIDVARYSEPGVDWVDVKSGEFIRGCRIGDGVYAITTTSIRIFRASGSTGQTVPSRSAE
jgi:hypothetical protein